MASQTVTLSLPPISVARITALHTPLPIFVTGRLGHIRTISIYRFLCCRGVKPTLRRTQATSVTLSMYISSIPSRTALAYGLDNNRRRWHWRNVWFSVFPVNTGSFNSPVLLLHVCALFTQPLAHRTPSVDPNPQHQYRPNHYFLACILCIISPSMCSRRQNPLIPRSRPPGENTDNSWPLLPPTESQPYAFTQRGLPNTVGSLGIRGRSSMLAGLD